MALTSRKIVIFATFCLLVTCALARERLTGPVTYDARSLIINGSRELLFSGSIHYTRAPQALWPELIRKARDGGLNTIQTYVFWNIHEPVEGQYNFEGNNDLVKFIKLIAENDMYCILRLGPFIQSEWNLGGLPYWLREVKDITFRTYNEPFMNYMKKYTEMIVDMMKKEKLFAPQGGPIILAQIENEYDMVSRSYRENGPKYIQWAADMATSTYSEIPWVMCKQKNAPANVISACNGRHCAETFEGPGPNKPSLWTENWTAQFRTWGDPPSQRSAEDIAFSVARFFAKNGSMTNYYMYYGGTNYGRTASSFMLTRYYDEAPLDEYGLRREPKWGHLKDLHRALRLAKKAFLWGNSNVQQINQDVSITTYENPGKDLCVAFLSNDHKVNPATVQFRGQEFYLPRRSVSILPDCKTLVFNTDTIVSQHNARNFHPSKKATGFKWEVWREPIPTMNDMETKSKAPREHVSTTRDTSDYLWYSTTIEFDRDDLPMRADILPVLQAVTLGDALVAFVNGEYIGFGHGSFVEKGFSFAKPISVKPGTNHISILGMTVGLPNNGAYMEKRFSGIRAVTIQGMNAGTLDITYNQWGHKVGITGEKNQIYTEEGSKKVQWAQASGPGTPLTWYKTTFVTPEGKSPVAIRMNKMGKGMVWINGNNIGRYWANFRTPLGSPSQTEYHIPRAFLNGEDKENLMVVLEESGGNIEGIQIVTVNRDTICSFINENHPPNVNIYERSNQMSFRPVVEGAKAGAHLVCTDDKIITAVEFASFGDPWGACGSYMVGKCDSPNSKKVIEGLCLGKNSCIIPLEREAFDGQNKDSCGNIAKTLAVQVRCAHDKKTE